MPLKASSKEEIHRVGKCGWEKFSTEFFTQISDHFVCIFYAQLTQSLWSGYHWNRPPAELEHEWCQFWPNVMTLQVEESQWGNLRNHLTLQFPCNSYLCAALATSPSEVMNWCDVLSYLIIKSTISLIVIGLKNSYFPLMHLSSYYRTACYRTVCYRTVQ